MSHLLPDYKPTRVEVLKQYQILDTPPESVFDELTQLAAQICQTPVALITFVDANRQWFKSRLGVNFIEASLNSGFCPFVVEKCESLVIADTLTEDEYATNPVVVSPPHVRFYAGVPLVTSQGYVLGTLCVLDFVPRQLSQENIQVLQTLGRQVMVQLEAKFAARQALETDTALIEVVKGVSESIGEEFFYLLVEHLSKALIVDYAYVGRVDENKEIIETIALYAHGQVVENVKYSLRETPCKQVIQQKKVCCYPRNLQAIFPQAPMLGELEVESYAAVPLFHSTGTPLGILGVMSRRPLDKVQLAESLLSIFGTRAATEMERQQTEAERAEILFREKEARQQAEQANRLKDQFLAVLSHELRTPLNPILGWTQLLRSGKLNEKMTEQALSVIERNAKLQTQLIDDLLDVSSILRGKLNLNVDSVDLVSVIDAAMETLRLAAQAKSIDLRFLISVQGDTNERVYVSADNQLDNQKFQVLGDFGRLVQVVWNLLTNAVKFTPNGGRVEIRLERVGQYAQIRVSDTGKGIEFEFLPHVFDYFRQGDSTITREFGGLGLGLAIVRHLVELHGGTVHAASPGEGKGATFVVQLPILQTDLLIKSNNCNLEQITLKK
jgi:signal transduction histidine kinase